MKNLLQRGVSDVLPLLAVVGILCVTARCVAQDNVWTSPASGNWQDASWSLGALPGTNHTIWITNYGWKAVQIGSATAQIFPESLNVNAINISSPTNSFNTLLLNHAGAPLTVRALTVASNSAVAMVSSALQINGPNGSGAMIGGELDQNDSVVTGNQINVGYIGSGVYNFNSGYFTVSHLWLGGSGTPGVFNQNGGTNGFGITHLDGGTYVLSNGWYGATIYFNGGQFKQCGGILATDLTIFQGNYVLAGGVHQGALMVPSYNQFTSGSGTMLQSGGTNYGSLDIGSEGYGIYVMSNGVSYAPNVTLGDFGSYRQSGGVQTIAGSITLAEDQVDRWGGYQGAYLNLDGGQMSSSGMYSEGFYTQTGGTNLISGDVTIQGFEHTTLTISGGLFTANNLNLYPGYAGGISITGGRLVITNTLSVGGANYFSSWHGFSCGGFLCVSNISLAPQAIFSCGDGLISQTGILTMANAKLYSGSNSVQLGALCLASGGDTNSTLYMVTPTSIITFADSSGVTWSNEPMLVVEGWSGSLYGGGQQQIVFGKNASALTSAQVGQIQFHNPAGLAEGTYPSRILPSGEIVPVSGAASPASMALNPQPGGMQVILQGEAGHVYSIETSTDLVHWSAWTNQMNSTGTISITDTDAANYPMRFYRAKPMP